ncbi:proline racemase family protein, partial [Bacillus sp. 'calajunan']|uniref:proline racemase family protein n=1 Tax=Bacillus sp. 'calajunan' TaxID=3447457 RepID=UPI003EE36BF1
KPRVMSVSWARRCVYERDALQKGEIYVHECITDGKFEGEVLSVTAADTYEAVVPKVTGNAFISGCHQFVVDPRDELNRGFL